VAPSLLVEPDPERERICDALIELVAERGYPQLTAAALQDRAGVDRETFERHFADLDDCFGMVWDELDSELAQRLFAAFSKSGPWRDRIRAGLAAELSFLSENETRARLYVSEPLFAGAGLQTRRRAAIERLTALIDLGSEESGDRLSPPHSVAVGIAGAIWHHVRRLIQEGRGVELEAKLPEFMYLVALPYLGSKAAREELRRPLA
jgi:AcrR family transcriptional regulator